MPNRSMYERRPILAWLLLTAFVVGGVAGPALHRVHHGTEQIAERSQKPCHEPGVHNTEGPVWAHAAPDLRVLDCLLCARRLLVVPPTPHPMVAARVAGTSAVETRSHVAAPTVVRTAHIRGPPCQPEARLA